jgi:leader peptidase (prepilin peptidase)/N-methyltransferase
MTALELLPGWLVATFVGAFGAVLGSFLNVCIHRLPLGESVVHPRSRCPGCGSPIAWYQNVPVLSWVALRGRCAACGTSISWRYPAVEAVSAILLVALWSAFGATAAFPIAGAFVLAMLALFFTDWDHKLLPDAITLSGFVVGVAIAWFNPFLGEAGWRRVWLATAGAALGAGILWGIGALYKRLRGIEAMGMGDVKMMAFVGAWAGPEGVLFTLFAGSVVGAVVGLASIPLRGGSMKSELPFGCFLAPAAVAALLVGKRALEAYYGLLIPGP